MTKLRVQAFTISLDGFGAGPNQGLEQPLGVGGETLHEWFFPTRTFRAMASCSIALTLALGSRRRSR